MSIFWLLIHCRVAPLSLNYNCDIKLHYCTHYLTNISPSNAKYETFIPATDVMAEGAMPLASAARDPIET